MSLERRKAIAMARGLAAATLLSMAGIGSAAAQTGTITFLGAITSPSCGFRPSAGLVHASCRQPSGQVVSAPVAVTPDRLPGLTRIGMASLEVHRTRAGTRSAAPAYLVMVSYH
ncbi:hypothetical protein [Cupriavidus sp. MP-37]|uniref:hypothetical protein n=1 Tax=Cupriavidus sp. MP-37 TaxID=2884455 RepID=UPI001D0AF3AA|nr:hypothetical protein [Cupriavidus sp. MP-37]UDM53655.1 hypothetical protein LIN44_20330 [Cupriavidus sp. MP-37]